jgi:hypothetical protein
MSAPWIGRLAGVLPPPAAPLRFLIRLSLISLALLWIAQIGASHMVAALLPAIRAEVEALDGNISISSLDLSQDGLSNVVRMRANLLMPIYTQHYVVYPRGWKPHTSGGYQVMLNARSVLESSLILLIAILSWPHQTLRELMARLWIALPLCALLIAIETPFELLGNFEHAVLRDVDPHVFQASFAWDKFLDGGGNLVFALASAALAIKWAAPDNLKHLVLIL